MDLKAKEKAKEMAIQTIVELICTNPFHVEFVAKEKPEGVKIIVEVTQEELDEAMAGRAEA